MKKMTIVLPDNATNGDVLMSLFDVQIGQEYIDGSVKTNLDGTSYFSGEFWYAPYDVKLYGATVTEDSSWVGDAEQIIKEWEFLHESMVDSMEKISEVEDGQNTIKD